MSGKDIGFKAFVATEQVAAYLEDLARGLRAGTVYLRAGEDSVELSPAETMEIELEATEKKGKQKLSLEVAWRRAAETPAQTGGLTISSTKPDVAELSPSPPEGPEG